MQRPVTSKVCPVSGIATGTPRKRGPRIKVTQPRALVRACGRKKSQPFRLFTTDAGVFVIDRLDHGISHVIDSDPDQRMELDARRIRRYRVQDRVFDESG